MQLYLLTSIRQHNAADAETVRGQNKSSQNCRQSNSPKATRTSFLIQMSPRNQSGLNTPFPQITFFQYIRPVSLIVSAFVQKTGLFKLNTSPHLVVPLQGSHSEGCVNTYDSPERRR